MKKLLIFILILSFLVNGCSSLSQNLFLKDISNSINVKKVFDSIDKKIFEKKRVDIDADIWMNHKALEYSQEIINKLTKLQWSNPSHVYFMVHLTAQVQASEGTLFSPEIHTTVGMLNMIQNEAEFAALLGHELGHMALGHNFSSRTSDPWQGVISNGLNRVVKDFSISSRILEQRKQILDAKFSQDHETSADRFGAELAAKAGYDPYAFCELLQRLSKKVNLNPLYRLGKLKGTHPGIDVRVSTLRTYLHSKGYKEGQGVRDSVSYQKAMAGLFFESINNTQQLSNEDKKQLENLKDLLQIKKEIEYIKSWHNPLTIEQFNKYLQQVSSIAKKAGIQKDELMALAIPDQKTQHQFLEESISQDFLTWLNQESIHEQIKTELKEMLVLISQMGLSSIPVIGNAISFYEVLSGEDLFTGEELSVEQGTLSVLSVFVGSGKVWREIAVSIKQELINPKIIKIAHDIPKAEKSLDKATEIYEDTFKETKFIDHEPPKVGQNVYRIYGKDVEKDIDAKGAQPFGNSWTPIKPDTIVGPRNGLGLPSQNKGRFIIEGKLLDIDNIKIQPAQPLHGNPGGITEYIIMNPEKQIKIEKVSGINSEI